MKLYMQKGYFLFSVGEYSTVTQYLAHLIIIPGLEPGLI
jgi:hypothetical protein